MDRYTRSWPTLYLLPIFLNLRLKMLEHLPISFQDRILRSLQEVPPRRERTGRSRGRPEVPRDHRGVRSARRCEGEERLRHPHLRTQGVGRPGRWRRCEWTDQTPNGDWEELEVGLFSLISRHKWLHVNAVMCPRPVALKQGLGPRGKSGQRLNHCIFNTELVFQVESYTVYGVSLRFVVLNFNLVSPCLILLGHLPRRRSRKRSKVNMLLGNWLRRRMK